MIGSEKIWMDGVIVETGDAKVPIHSYVVHYGAGVFEGLRIYETSRGRTIFRLYDHMARFRRSAKVLGLDIKYTLDELSAAVKETVRQNGPEADYIRPLAYFGSTGGLGLDLRKAPTCVAILTSQMGSYIGEDQQRFGAKLVTASWEKPSNNAAALNAKICGNYVNSLLAKMDAQLAGADEAILLNTNGSVAEGSGENFFIIRDEELITPGVDAGILEGITRNSVMQIAIDLGYNIHERNITRSEMYMADEAFITGTAAEITPIRMIDGRSIGHGRPGPITSELQGLFSEAARGKRPEYMGWLDLVEEAPVPSIEDISV